MKSILVIGIGRFGKHLCENLVKNGNDVMAVDEVEEKLEDILPIVTSAKIGDCTREVGSKALAWEILIFALYVLEQISRAAWRLQAC